MVELLSYALVLSGTLNSNPILNLNPIPNVFMALRPTKKKSPGNHVVTSGGGNGTNFAVIKGALRACNPGAYRNLNPDVDPKPNPNQH